ncbi:DUF7544 domain-containing protein [Haloplanus aerogenes]|uniref:Glycerophosphoryl diester phosphodiesterase membrane domain-containing protein n=1 Tax=Haloplanus aerogenes TaxID=660522 RepID=A0A3M0DZ49_9EURY|nr:hypothetical protein [Haloplanus aerogenes]RMB25226.1 hypothetical protein ATH50_0310 [Haloplanus aerogenes]
MPSNWYAFAALSDARDATEDLLWPVDRGRWLRLALIALFVGIGGGAPTGGGNTNIPSGGGGGGGAPPDMPAPSMPDLGSVAAIILGIVAVIILLALVWSVVGAVMEFVLIAGLRDRDVSIRDPFREHFWPGMRLFGFRLVVGLGSLLILGIPLLAVFGLGISISPILLVLLVPLVILFGIVALVASIVLGLTTDFVVPTMLTEDRGVLDGWRRLWPTLRAEWKQTALYVVAKFVLGIAVSLAVSLVVLLAALIVAIPFALVGGALFFAASAAGVHTVGWVLVGILVALYVIVLIVVGLIVQVPALTFVRYYSLSVLGMLVPELDLVGVDRPGEDGEDGDGAATDNEDGDDGPDTGEEGVGTDTADDSPPPAGTVGV